MTEVSPELERLVRRLKALKGELQRRYGVREIAVFGSYVRGDNRPGSDLDVLVEFDRPPGLLGFLALEEHLSKALGVPVDLVRKASIRQELRESILKEAVPV